MLHTHLFLYLVVIRHPLPYSACLLVRDTRPCLHSCTK